jgi:hypothetical protein
VVKSNPRFIRDLLAPHSKALTWGLLAAVGEGIANLLDPWPLKIVLDNVLRGRQIHGWLSGNLFKNESTDLGLDPQEQLLLGRTLNGDQRLGSDGFHTTSLGRSVRVRVRKVNHMAVKSANRRSGP